jgi:3-methyl-2-oxobutanoate hydroxymethyltransferase
MARLNLRDLAALHAKGEKITMLTAYDATFARMLETAGVETLLVGDSLAMVIQGRESTLSVSLEEIAYHVECVARGAKRAFLLGDLPFGSYQEGPQQAMRSAARLMTAGAQMVKLEGGLTMAETVRFLVERGVPVCGHVGLVPQSVNTLGGYRVQGRDDAGAKRIADDVTALAEAGASMIVLEAIPAALAAGLTASIGIPTIGIGAGIDCSGQVLVTHDMLGISDRSPKFVRNFMQGAQGIADAAARYVAAVKDGSFPAAEHSY